jgi:hypothetical protein
VGESVAGVVCICTVVVVVVDNNNNTHTRFGVWRAGADPGRDLRSFFFAEPILLRRDWDTAWCPSPLRLFGCALVARRTRCLSSRTPNECMEDEPPRV